MKMISILLGVILSTTMAQAQTKVGFVDTQKAIQESKMGKKAKAEMEKEGEKKKKELDKKKADLEKMRDDLEKKRSLLSEEAFNKKAQELQEEGFKFQQIVGKTQNELQKKESDLLAPIVDKMKAIIEKTAKEKGLQMVIQTSPVQQTVLYGDESANITKDVISAMDK